MQIFFVVLYVVIMVYALTRDGQCECDGSDCDSCPFPPCKRSKNK